MASARRFCVFSGDRSLLIGLDMKADASIIFEIPPCGNCFLEEAEILYSPLEILTSGIVNTVGLPISFLVDLLLDSGCLSEVELDLCFPPFDENLN